MWIWIILIILVVLFVYLYNLMVRLNLRCNSSWSNIDIELKKRVDLIPNLVETVKKYVDYEETTLVECINARNTTIGATAKTSDEISKNVKKIFALQEKYPHLKADLEFKNLQIELANIEDKIAQKREEYNNDVKNFNTALESFPTNFLNKILKYHKKQYFNIKEADKEPIKVEL